MSTQHDGLCPLLSDHGPLNHESYCLTMIYCYIKSKPPDHKPHFHCDQLNCDHDPSVHHNQHRLTITIMVQHGSNHNSSYCSYWVNCHRLENGRAHLQVKPWKD